MGFRGPCSPNRVWFARVWLLQHGGALQQARALQWAGTLQGVRNLQRVLKMYWAKLGTRASLIL